MRPIFAAQIIVRLAASPIQIADRFAADPFVRALDRGVVKADSKCPIAASKIGERRRDPGVFGRIIDRHQMTA